MSLKNFRSAAFLIVGLAGTAWLTGGAANAGPARGVSVAVNKNIPEECSKLSNAYSKLSSAQDDLAGVLGDFNPSDSIYPKLKESDRQIVDAITTVRSRSSRLHCR